MSPFLLLLKALFELALMFVVGRTILSWLVREQGPRNVFWQLLDTAARPALAITRMCLWQSASPATVTLVTLMWVGAGWAVLAVWKLRACLAAGVGAC